MPEPKTILVATDFSPVSEAAVAKAFELAAKLDVQVQVLHVFTLQDKSEVEAASEHDTRTVDRRKLDAVANLYRDSGHLGEVLWRDGDPASEIVNAVEDTHADLVLLGVSGRTGWQRLRLGSVAESVVREAPCNVLVVRPGS